MKQENKKGKTWIKKETRPYRAYILLLMFLTVFATLFSLGFAYLVQYVINSATSGNQKGILLFSVVILGMLIFKIFLKSVSSFCSESLRAKITIDLRTRYFSKILRANYAQTQGYHSGEFLQRLTTDIQEISADTAGLLPATAGMITQCVGAIVALLTIDPVFTAVYVVCGCIFGGITALFRKFIKKKYKEMLEADGKFRTYLQEGLGSILTVKAYGAEEKSRKKAAKFAGIYYEKRMRRNVLNASIHFVFNILSNFGLVLAVVWCSFSIFNGNPNFGSMLSVILLLMQLQHPFAAFSSLIPAYYSQIASAERLAEIDEIPREPIYGEKTEYHKISKISFEELSFSYGREEVLSNVDFTVDTGKIICLTGASGSGKSTIFKLLLNVFSPTDGGIYLIGENEKTLLEAKDRGLFAYVPQGNFLFSGTIYENLMFFREDTSQEEADRLIRRALNIACAEFVYELPEGLQTKIAEGGEGLSEGQLQRLAVARAILSDRKIFLFDESTSALDAETERNLLKNIKELEDTTCFIVTHRPAALEIADTILSVENRKISKIK